MTTKQEQPFIRTFGPLFLAILIDGMGMGILFPVLNTVLVDPAHTILSHDYSPIIREIVYGLIMGVFMLAWFFGAAILGDYSDSVGRKKALIICLIGSSAGYWISAVGLNSGSVFLLLVGRMIDGFTGGSQSIAQAAVVDLSTPACRAQNMGRILFAASLGFILGPLIGAFFAMDYFVIHYGYCAALYFAAIISGFNAILIHIGFNDTEQKFRQFTFNFMHAIHLFTAAFVNKNIRFLSLILFMFTLGWGTYFTFVPVYLLKIFLMSPAQQGLYLSIIALGFAIGTGGLIKPLNSRFSLSTMITGSLLCSGLTMLSAVFIHNLIWIHIAGGIIGIANAVAFTAIVTLFSELVPEDEQGWVMGVTGSVEAAAFAISCFAMGMISSLGVIFPLVFSALMLLSVVLLQHISRQEFVCQ